MHTQNFNRLPYIVLPELDNAKFLIDSGASASSISSKLVDKYFQEYVYYEPYLVKTMHGITQNDYKIEIPSLETFNDPVNLYTFSIIDFSDKFDGILGNDYLENTQANLNYKHKILETSYANIPFYTKNPIINLSPRTRQIIKIPVQENEGEYLISHKELIKGVEIPNAIIAVNNYETLVEVTNFNEYPVKFVCDAIELESIINIPEDKQLLNTTLSYSQIKKIQLRTIKEKLRIDHLNKEEQNMIKNLTHQYSDIIHSDSIPLTCYSKIKHEIYLNDDTPVYQKPYRKPYNQKLEIKRQVNKMMEQGIISESASPWSSPISLVPKKIDASGEQKWRLVIDYRRLNEKTVKDKYPLPNITEILDKLGRANYFTTLDLASAYNQIEIKETDRQKTAFITDQGLYEFNRMPFGLCNAPSTFQRAMNNILRGLTDEICHVYLDDIIIFSTSLQQHKDRLDKVFKRLRENGVKISLDKCEFMRKELRYLGHLITSEGVKPDPSKIEVIKKYPLPKTKTEIKAFAGLLGYYRKFIKDYAKILKPMTKCLAKDQQVIINDEYRACFEKCKTLLCNDPILIYPNFEEPFIITTDASNFAIGAILSQGKLGNDKPVAYASRTLSKTEIKYSTLEKEFLSIIYACKQFRPYIYGTKFTLVTDHKPLLWIHNLKDNNLKLQRWKVYLQEYDYNIVYKAGKLNVNADALSRIEINAMDQISNNATSGSDVDILDEDEDNQNSEGSLNSNQYSEHENSIPISNDPIDVKSRQFFFYYHNLPTSIDITLGNTKIYKCHVNKDKAYDEIFRILRDYGNNKDTFHVYCNDELYQLVCRIYLEKFIRKGMKLIRCLRRVEIVKDQERQLEIITQCHEGKSNHRGITETIERIKRNYSWKNLQQMVAKSVNACEYCQRTKYDRRPPITTLQTTETPSDPMQILHIDLFRIDSSIFLTVIDKFSKFAQAYEVKDKNSITIAESLTDHFSKFGAPMKIICDKGTEFKNKLVQELLKLYKIEVHFATTGHHESNSPVERLHSTLIEHFRLLKLMDKKIGNKIAMSRALLAYNSTINPQTKFTPFEILYGRTKTLDPINIAYEQKCYEDYVEKHKGFTKTLYDNIKQNQQMQKETIIEKRNQGKIMPTITVGAEVYWKTQQQGNKSKFIYQGPYIVNKLLENNKVELTPGIGTRLRTKIAHIKELKIRNLAGASSQDATVP